MTKEADDLKRIVGVNLDPAKSKDTLFSIGGIQPTRVIAVQSGGGVSVNSFGTTVDDKDKNKNKGVDEKKETDADKADKVKPPGQLTGGLPDSSGREDGVDDAIDIIDNKAGPDLLQPNPIVFDDAITSGDSLKGINAQDCATGDDLNIRLDGWHVPPEATFYPDGTQKTSEWADPNTPPDKLGFRVGFYWAFVSNNTTYQATTQFESAELAATAAGDTIAGFTLTATSPLTYIVLGVTFPGGFTTIREWPCGAGTVDVCPPTAPKEMAWPDDSTISLTLSNGQFITNDFDNDAPITYTDQQNSVINFCMAGGRTGTLEAGINGGSLLYETSGGSPTGIVRYYNAQGEFRGASDGASADMFRPKTA